MDDILDNIGDGLRGKFYFLFINQFMERLNFFFTDLFPNDYHKKFKND